MGSRSTPKTDATSDTRPCLLSLWSSAGRTAGQSRQTGHTGYAQHVAPGDEWVRLHRVIFSHKKPHCVAVWQALKARLYRRTIAVAKSLSQGQGVLGSDYALLEE